ncbi:MAG: UspA domain containing protein [Comamonadaceae bacterium]|nr:MAG: UspA domain containing protein [Comamonadaceae bacterium]
MYKHLLVPLDASGLATEIVSQAVPFAAVLGARITFFTAQVDFAATEQGALQRTVAPDRYSDNLAGEARGILQKAVAAAKAAGVDCTSITRTSDRPAEVILDVAQAEACDLIFMASHGRKGIRGLLLSSQTQKVLASTRIPVLVATVESNQSDPYGLMAVAIIQDEHRSLAAVVRGLLHLVEQAVTGESTLDVPLALTMIHYIDAFPERLHHPKEDAYLFERLAARTKACDAAIKELRAQHAGGGEHVQAMQTAVEHFATGQGDAGQALAGVASAVNVFAQAQWEHMNLEEQTILPGARKHLTEQDWMLIYTAFSANGDPRFDADLGDGFKTLYSRIMNLAAT